MSGQAQQNQIQNLNELIAKYFPDASLVTLDVGSLNDEIKAEFFSEALRIYLTRLTQESDLADFRAMIFAENFPLLEFYQVSLKGYTDITRIKGAVVPVDLSEGVVAVKLVKSEDESPINTISFWAVEKRDYKTARDLVEWLGRNQDFIQADDVSLRWAIVSSLQQGNIEAVSRIIDTFKPEVFLGQDWYGATPLELAIGSRNQKMIDLLIDRFKNYPELLLKVGSNDESPLYKALARGYGKLAHLIIDTFSDYPDLLSIGVAKGMNYCPLLTFAIEQGFIGVAEKLCEVFRGRTDLLSQPVWGITPLYCAISDRDIKFYKGGLIDKLIDYLKEDPAKMLIKNARGGTAPILEATYSGRFDVAEYIIKVVINSPQAHSLADKFFDSFPLHCILHYNRALGGYPMRERSLVNKIIDMFWDRPDLLDKKLNDRKAIDYIPNTLEWLPIKLKLANAAARSCAKSIGDGFADAVEKASSFLGR